MSVFTVSPPKRTFLDPVLPGMGWYGKVSANAAPVFSVKFIHIYISPVSKADRNQMSNEHILYMDAYIYRIMCTIHIIYKRNVETTAYVFDTGQT